MSTSSDARRYAPATERNREPILAVLQRVLPATGTVLEVSSGTGEHAAYFAPRLAPRQWLPSDLDPGARASIAAWREAAPAANLHAPLALDAAAPLWPVESENFCDLRPEPDLQEYPITALVNINMIHIAPWAACRGLLAGAGRILPPGGILVLYGPYKQNGQHTAPSNAAFDTSLQAQNPEWGVRDLDAVVAAAKVHHLALVETIAMPANNLSVVFRAIG
ncbi:SAM-dependent methyltransferase [filamentous cyanobacterium CCP3]|nr:SAM-dependent methyltransferase [filamentous cyanobacterium CCP3]